MDEITLWGEGAGCFKSLLRKGSKSQPWVWCYQIFLPGLKPQKLWAGDELLSSGQRHESLGL